MPADLILFEFYFALKDKFGKMWEGLLQEGGVQGVGLKKQSCAQLSIEFH